MAFTGVAVSHYMMGGGGGGGDGIKEQTEHSALHLHFGSKIWYGIHWHKDGMRRWAYGLSWRFFSINALF